MVPLPGQCIRSRHSICATDGTLQCGRRSCGRYTRGRRLHRRIISDALFPLELAEEGGQTFFLQHRLLPLQRFDALDMVTPKGRYFLRLLRLHRFQPLLLVVSLLLQLLPHSSQDFLDELLGGALASSPLGHLFDEIQSLLARASVLHDAPRYTAELRYCLQDGSTLCAVEAPEYHLLCNFEVIFCDAAIFGQHGSYRLLLSLPHALGDSLHLSQEEAQLADVAAGRHIQAHTEADVAVSDARRALKAILQPLDVQALVKAVEAMQQIRSTVENQIHSRHVDDPLHRQLILVRPLADLRHLHDLLGRHHTRVDVFLARHQASGTGGANSVLSIISKLGIREAPLCPSRARSQELFQMRLRTLGIHYDCLQISRPLLHSILEQTAGPALLPLQQLALEAGKGS
mmetsp:Transcript_1648/g.3686  ORF Transcript_1648/g.3686 Transcript_1648/m.3686 type:complete len:402 (+) Transcript_1648:823-2028(+)